MCVCARILDSRFQVQVKLLEIRDTRLAVRRSVHRKIWILKGSLVKTVYSCLLILLNTKVAKRMTNVVIKSYRQLWYQNLAELPHLLVLTTVITTAGVWEDAGVVSAGAAWRKIVDFRCGECSNCLEEDCGDCRACKEMPKFGGRRRVKLACINRQCL